MQPVVVIAPTLHDQAEELYLDQQALHHAKNLRLPTGEKIDYVFAYVTPFRLVCIAILYIINPMYVLISIPHDSSYYRAPRSTNACYPSATKR